jgi:hypothetical protein
VRNLHTFSTEVISLGVSSSDIPPQAAGGSRKTVGWEKIVLAYHNRELVVPANLRIKVDFSMVSLSGPNLRRGAFQYEVSFCRLFSARSQQFWYTTSEA